MTSASDAGPVATAASSKPAQERDDVVHADLAAPVAGHQVLPVDHHEAVLAGGHGSRQLFDVALVVAQEAAQHEVVIAVAQRGVHPHGGIQRERREAVGGAQACGDGRVAGVMASEGGSPRAGCGIDGPQSSD